MKTTKIILGLLASSALAACSTVEADNTVNANVRAVEARLPQSRQPLPAADLSPVKVREGSFVVGKAIRNENGDPLPARFEGANGITMVRKTPQTLREVIASVTAVTKIPVVLAAPTDAGSAAAPAGGATAQDSSAPASPGLASGPVPAGFPLQQALSAIGGGGSITASGSGVTADAIPLDYSGRLSGLLDMISAHFNVAWKYTGGRIVFDSVVTRSFDVPSLPVVANLTFNLSSQSESNGEGGTSSAGQNASTTSAADIWKDVNAALTTMVGAGGYAVNGTTGIVTVTTNPATATRVGEYIKTLNERLAKQVVVSVNVYSVGLTDTQQFDLNVAGILNKGSSGFNLGNLGPAAAGVVPTPVGAGAGLGWAILNPNSKFAGSQALLNALSQRGNVSVVTNASVTTLNGIPVPLQVGTLRDYVKQVETTTEEGVTTTSVTPGSVTTGFNLHLVPRIERNGDVLLQYGINISELTGAQDGFDTFTTNDQTLQLRRVNQRNFIQQARIPNGATLVLAGFEQVRTESNKTGSGHVDFPLFGGSRGSRIQRDVIVIVITPTVLAPSSGN